MKIKELKGKIKTDKKFKSLKNTDELMTDARKAGYFLFI